MSQNSQYSRVKMTCDSENTQYNRVKYNYVLLCFNDNV